MTAAKQTPTGAGATVGSRTRRLVNRGLFVVALLAIVLGVALGQTFITWLNATLL